MRGVGQPLATFTIQPMLHGMSEFLDFMQFVTPNLVGLRLLESGPTNS